MRKMLDRKDIDVIGNATQNYWHGLSTIWACQAGKHVYVEKPLVALHLGRPADGQRRPKVQPHRPVRHAAPLGGPTSLRRSNGSAKATSARSSTSPPLPTSRASSCGKRDTPLPIPESIDYDLWCGPARKVPIYRDRLQYDCSFDWNTGDGESCNQGVHEMDVARWCLGETMLPRRVMSIGGRFVFNDACDVPNTQIIYYDFPTAPVLYEVHNLPQGQGLERDARRFAASRWA